MNELIEAAKAEHERTQVRMAYLRSQGWDVKITHKRRYKEDGSISPTGGQTRVQIIRRGEPVEYNGEQVLLGGIMVSGVACCHPNDHFNKLVGRHLAFTRAFNMMAEVLDHGI